MTNAQEGDAAATTASAHAGTGAGLDAFLIRIGERGEMNRTTARAYQGAVKRILSLEPDPANVDIKSLDVENLIDRFETLNRLEYTEQSLRTYRSRFRQ